MFWCCRGLFGLWFYEDLYISLLLTIIYCWGFRCCRGLFGLWFDGDLYHGQTHHCDTYDNDILTSNEDFIVKVLEAWISTQDWNQRARKIHPLTPQKMDGISNTGSYARKNSWFQMLLEGWNHFVKCHCHGSSLLRMNAQMTLGPLILSQ